MSQALCNGLDTLKVLSSKRSVGVTEVAEAIGVNKSTAFRILRTLQNYNMAEQDPVTNKYKLGPAILMMADQFAKNVHIMATAKSLLTRLSEELKESCHLCMLSNEQVVMIEQVGSKYQYANNSKIGIKEPLHASSVGKCLVAFSDAEKQQRLVETNNYEIYNDRTIQSPDEFYSEIEKIKKQGYAVDDFEISYDTKCVAVPVFGRHGFAKYSIGVSGTKIAMTDERVEDIVSRLQSVSKAIEKSARNYR